MRHVLAAFSMPSTNDLVVPWAEAFASLGGAFELIVRRGHAAVLRDVLGTSPVPAVIPVSPREWAT